MLSSDGAWIQKVGPGHSTNLNREAINKVAIMAKGWPGISTNLHELVNVLSEYLAKNKKKTFILMMIGWSPVNTGSSHMQVRNDRNLKRSLVEIFEGKHGGFFATDKRE